MNTAISYDHVKIKPKEQIGLHHWNTWELSYIIKGRGTRILGDTTEDFQKGDLILVVPDMPHQWKFDNAHTDKDGNIENISISFPYDMLDKMSDVFPEYKEMAKWYASLTSSLKLPKPDNKEIIDIIQRMDFEEPEQRVISLLQILTIIRKQSNYEMIGHFKIQDSIVTRIEKVKTYLSCNFQRDVSIEDIALYIGMNRSSLCTFFKRYTGRTIIQWLTDIRLDAARQALTHENITIAECCYKCGFNDVPHFNRVFKKHEGISPKEYRAKTAIKRKMLKA